MTLQRTLHVSVKLLTCIAFSSLAATGKLPWFLVIIGFISLAISMGQEVKCCSGWRKIRFRLVAWHALLMVACLAMAADFLWGSRNALQASLYVLIFLMIHKLLVLACLKDIPQLLVIGFMEFLASAVLTVDLWYAVAFVVYLLTAIWTLLLYHICCETVHDMGVAGEANLTTLSVPFTARFFWTTNAIALAALAVTSSIFLIMPRTGFGFFQKAEGAPIRTSGFSEKVDLGVIGAVKQDPTLVMRVQFPDLEGEPSERVYMRGASFDHYTGQSWINSFSRRRVVAKTDDGVFEIAKPRRLVRTPPVNQEVLMEALDISVLFGLPFATDIRGPFTSVETDAMGSLWLTQAPPGRLQYSVTSMPHYLTKEDRESDTSHYPLEGTSRFLQLPLARPGIIELARTMTRDATTPYEMAVAVRQYLLSHYLYTLDVGLERSEDPLSDFLFTRKTGYCEHYATAMVILLRSLGVPARLVTGFLASEWNNFGHYYTIRQQDAHAWVEVWFPQSGWITFDPTPGIVNQNASPIFKQIGSIVDSLRLKWDRFVIHYSFYDQMTVAKGIRQQGETARESIYKAIAVFKSLAVRALNIVNISNTRGHQMFSLMMLGGFICMVAFILWRRRHRRDYGVVKRELMSIQMYERMLKILNARGFEKAPASTPREFYLQIERHYPLAGPIVCALTELYYRARFSQESLSSYDQQKTDDLLTQLMSCPKP